MKVSLIVFIVCAMILSVGMPQAAYAKNANVKNPAKAKLSLNTTYNGYDVTGDGKADTIRISSVSLEADEWNVGLKVEINGKKVPNVGIDTNVPSPNARIIEKTKEGSEAGCQTHKKKGISRLIISKKGALLGNASNWGCCRMWSCVNYWRFLYEPDIDAR